MSHTAIIGHRLVPVRKIEVDCIDHIEEITVAIYMPDSPAHEDTLLLDDDPSGLEQDSDRE
jgi:hypothetical protein